MRELLRDEAVQLLPKTFVPDEIDAHFEGMPTRYFLIHDARAVARDLTLAHRFMHLQLTEAERALEPALLWHDEPTGDTPPCTSAPGTARDCSPLTGALAAAGLNILAAQIYTRKDGIVDDFFVVDARTGKLPESSAAALREDRDRRPRPRPGPGPRPRQGSSNILRCTAPSASGCPSWFASTTSNPEDYTILDVEAEDRVGLLFALAATFQDLQLDIGLAKIVTEKGRPSTPSTLPDPTGKRSRTKNCSGGSPGGSAKPCPEFSGEPRSCWRGPARLPFSAHVPPRPHRPDPVDRDRPSGS